MSKHIQLPFQECNDMVDKKVTLYAEKKLINIYFDRKQINILQLLLYQTEFNLSGSGVGQ